MARPEIPGLASALCRVCGGGLIASSGRHGGWIHYVRARNGLQVHYALSEWLDDNHRGDADPTSIREAV